MLCNHRFLLERDSSSILIRSFFWPSITRYRSFAFTSSFLTLSKSVSTIFSLLLNSPNYNYWSSILLRCLYISKFFKAIASSAALITSGSVFEGISSLILSY